MANRIKYHLAQKLAVLTKNNTIPYHFGSKIQIKYEKTDIFVVINEKSDMKINKDILNPESFTHINLNNNQELRIKINNGFFMKNILEEIVYCKNKVETNPKTILIDFSSPNIAKPFHVGHLRSTIIGNFIARINKHFNADVVKINYLGDWGTQFGLLKFGIEKNKFNLDDITKDPLKYLYESYVLANKLSSQNIKVAQTARDFFSRLEKGEIDLGDWEKIKLITVSELEKVYKRLGVDFDVYSWESDYNRQVIKPLIDMMEKKQILTDEGGAKVIDVNGRKVTFLKSDDSTLYLTRDVAALIDRYKKFNFDEMLYIVDNSQSDHFIALFGVIEKIDENYSSKCKHVKFGRVKGMSTRKGNVVFLTDILDEAKKRMLEKQLKSPNTREGVMNEEVCDILGTSAVIINDLKQNRNRDYQFTWDRVLQSDGDSGIKLQYLHCRLYSLETKCGVDLPKDCEPSFLDDTEILILVAELARFEDVLERSRIEMEACILVNYLFKLAHRVNRLLGHLNVKGNEVKLAQQRLLLFHACRCVVKKGMEILGVRPLNEM